MPTKPDHSPSNPDSGTDIVFLHGWCGHADEVEPIRAAAPGRVLPISWMPAPGSFDLDEWPLPEDRAPGAAEAVMRNFADGVMERVGRTILDTGFAGATLVGHSLGGEMSCVLAADPTLAIRRIALLDASVPLTPERRDEYLRKMLTWVDRAASSGRLLAQAGWIAEASSWIPDFFSLEDQGPIRLGIERRLMFAPVVEAAMMIGGGVQWPVTESVTSLECRKCEIHGLAGDSGCMPAEALRELRPDARVEICTGTGHYPHLFAAERTRTWLADGPLRTTDG